MRKLITITNVNVGDKVWVNVPVIINGKLVEMPQQQGEIFRINVYRNSYAYSVCGREYPEAEIYESEEKAKLYAEQDSQRYLDIDYE